MPDTELDAISKTIRTVLAEQFGDLRLSDLQLEFETDEGGDEVLWIRAIVETKDMKRINGRTASRLVRHLRPRLMKLHVDAFPVLSFVPKADYRKNTPAAA